MKFFRAVLGLLVLASAAIVFPAFADIAAFNAAIKKGDYKAAASEAAATWPALDKSRDDIGVIAREFGFAAYVAGDHAAAKDFASFAAGKEADPKGETGLANIVLLRLAEHKLAPTAETRGLLGDALKARAAFPGLDAISYLGIDSLLAYDLKEGRWKDAQASSELAVAMTATGGSAYAIQHRRFQLFKAIADYRATRKAAAYRQFRDLQKAVANEIEAAPNEEEARRYVPLYWQIGAWGTTIDAHLRSRHLRGETKEDVEQDKEEAKIRDPDGNFARVIHKPHNYDVCDRSISDRKKPEYPRSALYEGYVGSVLVQVDIDEDGRISNPQILAAVPEEYFGEAVLESVVNMRFKVGKKWDPSICSLAEKAHIVSFQFSIG